MDDLADQVSNALLNKAASDAVIVQQPSAVDEGPSIARKTITNLPATGQLIGLEVKGRRILILFDISASMAEEKLIDIITGLADASGARLTAGPKWAQARGVMSWMLENAPDESQVQVIAFSDVVTPITQAWVSPQIALSEYNAKVAGISPGGGTSLGKVLEHVQTQSLDATDIYLITDGLPTQAGDKLGNLGTLKNCFNLSTSKSAYIDGACREALFLSAVERFEKTSNARINIVLLPLEGDPKAAFYYWAWASTNNGVLFAPARGWP